MSSIIGSVLFIDGAFRAVFIDHRGHEYFLGDDGQPVYGDWSYLDGPEIVANERTQATVAMMTEHVGQHAEPFVAA